MSPLTFTGKQTEFLRELGRPDVRAVVLLGALGAGKSTVGLAALLLTAAANPGATLAVARENLRGIAHSFGDLVRLADGEGVWEERSAASALPAIVMRNGARIVGIAGSARVPQPGMLFDAAFFDEPEGEAGQCFWEQLLKRALWGLGGQGKAWLAAGPGRPAWVDAWVAAPTCGARTVRFRSADNPHLPDGWQESVEEARDVAALNARLREERG